MASSEIPNSSIALRIQTASFSDQVLILARLVESRKGVNEFTTKEVLEVFRTNALPSPGNPADIIGKLRHRGMITPNSPGVWAITPKGRHASQSSLPNLDLAAFLAEASIGSSSLGRITHPVVPTSLAPPELLVPLRTFLDRHPFETNVFGMTRFPDSDDDSNIDPLQPSLQVARDICKKHGLTLHLASDRVLHDNLWTNVAGFMWACQFGIAFFEDSKGRGLNYNLTIEVGSMLMAGRRCALLKDKTILKMPTDLVGQIYKPVDLNETKTVEESLHRWMRDDLSLGPCLQCPKT